MSEINRHRLLARRWFYAPKGQMGFDLECRHRIDYDQLKGWAMDKDFVYCQICAAIPHPITYPTKGLHSRRELGVS